MPIYMNNKQDENSLEERIDERNYRKALKELALNLQNSHVRESCYDLGDIYYSRKYPGLDRRPEIECPIININLPSAKEIRFALIEHDMKIIKFESREKKAA